MTAGYAEEKATGGSVTEEQSIEDAVQKRFGTHTRITGKTPVSGGDINAAFRLTLSGGGSVFLKCNEKARAAMFEAEAAGLQALAASGCIAVTEPLAYGVDANEKCAFLLLSYIKEGKPKASFWEDFGRSLAALHRQETGRFVHGGRYGFFQDNCIGTSRQHNAPHGSWISFFREERLMPQFSMADRWFDREERIRCSRLLERLDELLIEPPFPSLLHGDLWGGNYMTGPEGDAVLIDPAVYVGCHEADLAMTELFGGFSPRFYDGYREVLPVDSGYKERRDLYNLYHLLNHLNLFGSGYRSAVLQILYRYT